MTSAPRIQESSTRQTALQQEQTEESAICKQKVPVLLSGMVSDKLNPEAKEIDVAYTMLSRDYKGLNNYGMNGVLECEKIT